MRTLAANNRVVMALLGALVPASGCGGGGDGAAAADLSVLPADLVLADLKAPGYPVGPYGAAVDDVLPNFTFQGYFSPTRTTGLASEESFGEVSFEMMRASGAKVAIVQLAAFWCGPCLANAQALTKKVAPYLGKGIFPWIVLTEGISPTGAAATKGNLNTWITRTAQPFTASLDSASSSPSGDPQLPLEEYFGLPRDNFLVIDLRTMRLVDVFDSNPTAALDSATQLLGP